MKKIPEGTGPHQKTLHLRPFWCGVQRGRDALGLAVYRLGDVPPDTPTLESHFVFPSDVDEIFAGDKLIKPERGKPFVHPLPANECLFVRKGAGAFAVRVAWARNFAGLPAPAALVWNDVAGLDACRLTVAHHDFWGYPMNPTNPPAAAFWVRVTDDAAAPAKFAAFRAAFAAARLSAQADASRIAIAAVGEDGPLALRAAAPFAAAEHVEPAPEGAVFALDGRDIGAEIIGDVPGMAEYRAERERMMKAIAANRIPVSLRRAARWEAENGAVQHNFKIDADPGAFGGKFVWTPGEPSTRHSGNGHASWQLDVHQAGTYKLWGRIWAPTPDDDSFFVSANAGKFTPSKKSRGPVVLERTEWHTGVTGTQWKWMPFPVEITLPAGPVVLTLHAREDGTKIDQMFITSDFSQEPTD